MNKVTPHKITLVSIVDLDVETQLMVRDIRNQDHVRRWMYTDHMISLNEHLAWIKKLKNDNRQIVFVVLDESQKPVGVVSLTPIDWLHKKTDGGFYFSKNAPKGLAFAIYFFMLSFVFDTLNLEKLNSEIMTKNTSAIKLARKFMFDQEGLRRSNVLKNEQRFDIALFGMTRTNWLLNKPILWDKNYRILEKFLLHIEWNPDKSNDKVKTIDKIEEARHRNNLNWMSILRLAIEKYPQTAKPLFDEIRKTDQEILELSNKLDREINT